MRLSAHDLTEDIKETRRNTDSLILPVSDSAPREKIAQVLADARKLKFNDISLEADIYNLQRLKFFSGLKPDSCILRLRFKSKSIPFSELNEAASKVKANLKLHLALEGWKDMDVLNRLPDIYSVTARRDTLVSIKKERDLYQGYVLNSIPILYRYIKGYHYPLQLRNIDPIIFETRVPLERIQVLDIEPNNTCNLSCIYCPTGTGKVAAGPHMSFAKFKEIVDQFKAPLREVRLFGRGEPFLNKDFIRMVAYLKSKGHLKVNVATNAHFLGRDNILMLLRSRLDVLVIALDSVKRSTYRKLRRDGDFDLVMKNIKLLARIASRYPLLMPKVVIQCVVSKYNESEIWQVKKFCERLGFSPVFKSIVTFDRDLLARDAKLTSSQNLLQKEERAVNFCPAPWRAIGIRCDGSVTTCGKTLSAPGEVGNLAIASLEAIWNGELYQEARKIMLTDKARSGCPVGCPDEFAILDLTERIIEGNCENIKFKNVC